MQKLSEISTENGRSIFRESGGKLKGKKGGFGDLRELAGEGEFAELVCYQPMTIPEEHRVLLHINIFTSLH